MTNIPQFVSFIIIITSLLYFNILRRAQNKEFWYFKNPANIFFIFGQKHQIAVINEAVLLIVIMKKKILYTCGKDHEVKVKKKEMLEWNVIIIILYHEKAAGRFS